MARKQPAPSAYRALMSFHAKDKAGVPRFISEGMRLREIVGPEAYWADDTLDDAELDAKRLALWERTEVKPEPAAPQGPRMMRALSTFTDRGMTIVAGELYSENHEAAIDTPEAFEPA